MLLWLVLAVGQMAAVTSSQCDLCPMGCRTVRRCAHCTVFLQQSFNKCSPFISSAGSTTGKVPSKSVRCKYFHYYYNAAQQASDANAARPSHPLCYRSIRADWREEKLKTQFNTLRLISSGQQTKQLSSQVAQF